MSKRMRDEEIGRILRSAQEPEVPPMPELRLPPRPQAMPRLPWRKGEIVLLCLTAVLGAAGVTWVALSGPGAVVAELVQLFLSPGNSAGSVLSTVCAAAAGGLVVAFSAPRQIPRREVAGNRP